MQPHTVRLAVFLACILLASGALATTAAETNTGPETMVLRSTIDPDKKPRAATFPHREHQARLDCAECHHGQGADGKQTPYVPGQQIAKCESCHNTKAEGVQYLPEGGPCQLSQLPPADRTQACQVQCLPQKRRVISFPHQSRQIGLCIWK